MPNLLWVSDFTYVSIRQLFKGASRIVPAFSQMIGLYGAVDKHDRVEPGRRVNWAL